MGHLRRNPPPWTAEETEPCFIVKDRNGQALAYVYCEEEPFSNATGAEHKDCNQNQAPQSRGGYRA